jgi:thiol-disulfide isomerase/thioredoxin
MKKIIFYLLILIIFPFTAYQQSISTGDTSLPYLKNPTIPAFKILKTDSITLYTKDSLPHNRPIVIIYFSTECSHCQSEAKTIAQHMDSLNNAFFVWIDYHHTTQEIQAFGEKYGLTQFKNIIIGKEIGFKIIPFYRIEYTPFMAVYNNSGLFVKEFRENGKVEELYEAIHHP